jgi:Arc/MetJ-type ribon-helix-helix transcriptional regulator
MVNVCLKQNYDVKFINYLVLPSIMDIISIKLDESLNKEIEKVMKPLYTTKTEFIREAIRDKIHEEKRKQHIQKVRENFGKGKGTAKNNLTDREMKELAGEEFLRERGWKLE